ncbi:MAG: radical SAM protein [Candidatus Aenigmatarchaeota archaeon]
MRVSFVNPPNTTSLHLAKPGTYVAQNVGTEFLILPRIPFEVLASVPPDFERDLVLLDFEWYKEPNLSKEDLVDIATANHPDIVCTTLISQASADTIHYLTGQIKQRLPDTKIVVGGQAVSHLGRKIFKYCPTVDIASLTDASYNLPHILESLRNDLHHLYDIPGIAYRENGEVKINLADTKRTTAKWSPQELYDTWKDRISEITDFAHSQGAYVLGNIETYKGCPYPCEFCLAKGPTSPMNSEQAIREIEYLYDLGIDRFYFVDLTFGLNREKTLGLLSELSEFRKAHPNFGFRCVTRSDRIDEEFVAYLKAAGCYEVGIGVEVNDDSVLAIMKKRTNENQHSRALEVLGKEGIAFKLFLIEGYPGSSSRTSKKTFELLNSVENQGYKYFIQPALSRNLNPESPEFVSREQNSQFTTGTIYQLDFRHDARRYGWNNDVSVRAFCLQLLAYPSTEIGKQNKDKNLQKRLEMDLHFLADDVEIQTALKYLSATPELEDAATTFVHYLDGVYSSGEIIQRLSKTHPNTHDIDKHVYEWLAKLRKKGFIDSFVKPREIIPRIDKSYSGNRKGPVPKRVYGSFLFWNGENKRWIYAPPIDEKAPKISTHIYSDIPEDVFEFLIMARGLYNVDEISYRMHRLFNRRSGFNSLEETMSTVNIIYDTCKNYGLCS